MHVLMLLIAFAAGIPDPPTAQVSLDAPGDEIRHVEDRQDEARPLDFDRVLRESSGSTAVVTPNVRRMESRYPVYRRRTDFVFDLPPGSLFVPYRLLVRGSDAVPLQSDLWSCGANSGARFAAMLKNEIRDYEAFKESEPVYGGFLGIPKIGVNPERMQDTLRRQTDLSSYIISQRCSRRFAPQFEILIKSLELGHPALVLFMESGTLMHWVNIVARNAVTENWYFMDTNQKIYMLTGGDDELKHRMNMDNCAAQRFGFVERFNSVTTTDCAGFTYTRGSRPDYHCQEGRISE
jgi:hypothetical protein